MSGLSNNTLGLLAFLLFVAFFCLYSSQALSRQPSGGAGRRCHKCGRTVADDDHHCPHCSADLLNAGRTR